MGQALCQLPFSSVCASGGGFCTIKSRCWNSASCAKAKCGLLGAQMVMVCAQEGGAGGGGGVVRVTDEMVGWFCGRCK